MESTGSDVFSESWQNCALIKGEIKVEKFNDDQVEVAGENSTPSYKNTASDEANVLPSFEKKKLQSELVICIKRLPIVIKAEKNINVNRLNDYSPEEQGNEHLIEESQYEINSILTREVKTEPSIIDIEEEESPSWFKNGKVNEKTIKEEHLVESKIIVQEELVIKDEDEYEGDQFSAKSSIGQVKKQHHPSNRTATNDRVSTNNRRFDQTESPVFKCLNCTYQTHRRKYIASHVLSHMEKTLKCSHCSYKTKTKGGLRQHELIHVPRELAKLHQCSECSFTSKWKGKLTQHMIKHKKAEDAIWYQCPDCPYKTKHRDNLRRQHMVSHIPKDIQSIHCQEEGCSFKTHHKTSLTRHIRLMHECKTLFKCSKCSYQTKDGTSFKAHELGHENQNKWFSCSLCPYKTTRTAYLKLHMMVHKSGNEIKWFHCSECIFKTKRNASLKQHKMIHNINTEKIFECSECSYKTVNAFRFRDHGLVHKKPEDISEWFYCYLCTLRVSRKGNLAHHIKRIHRDSNGRINDRSNTN